MPAKATLESICQEGILKFENLKRAYTYIHTHYIKRNVFIAVEILYSVYRLRLVLKNTYEFWHPFAWFSAYFCVLSKTERHSNERIRSFLKVSYREKTK